MLELKIRGLNKGGGQKGRQRSGTGTAATTTEDTEDNSSAPSLQIWGFIDLRTIPHKYKHFKF